MADPRTGRVEFYEADPRAIVPIEAPPGAPGGVRVARSLRASIRRSHFTFTSDRAFERVIAACAEPRPGQSASDQGWISPAIVGAYTLLHQAGHAHSIEAWLAPADPGAPPVLVGGLYGVHLGGAFFGESMFSRPELGGTDSSKICFIRLIEHLRALGVVLLDTQFTNPHMAQFGLVEIRKREYLRRLKAALAAPVAWRPL